MSATEMIFSNVKFLQYGKPAVRSWFHLLEVEGIAESYVVTHQAPKSQEVYGQVWFELAWTSRYCESASISTTVRNNNYLKLDYMVIVELVIQ